MSDQRPTPSNQRESSGNGNVLFILGAIVVAVGVLLWYVFGNAPGTTTGSSDTNNNVTVQTPAASAPAESATQVPAESTTAAPATSGTVDPAAAETAPAETAPATSGETAPADTDPAAPAAPANP